MITYHDCESVAYADAVKAASARLAQLAADFRKLDELAYHDGNKADDLIPAAKRIRDEADWIINNLIKWADSFSNAQLTRALHDAVGRDKFTIARPDV